MLMTESFLYTRHSLCKAYVTYSSGSQTKRRKTWHQIPALWLPCFVTLGKSLSLSRPQPPYPMLPKRLGFNELMSKINQEANKLGR